MLRKINYIIALFICTLCLYNCDKRSIIQSIIINGNDSLCENTNGSKLIYTVKFRAGTISFPTKSTSLSGLQQNRIVTVYCYYNMSDFKDSLSYNTIRVGVLSPLNKVQLGVIPGNYEFYAVGIANKMVDPPKFTDLEYGTISGVLQNGNDYISGYLLNQSITQNTELTLTMSHACSQVIIDFSTSSTQVILDSIRSVYITPPTTNINIYNLFTGIISPSKQISTTDLLEMNISGTDRKSVV